MILGDVEETVTSIEIDEETYEEIYKVKFWTTLKSLGLLLNKMTLPIFTIYINKAERLILIL